MGWEAYFPSVGENFFLTKALLFTSARYVNVRQFTSKARRDSVTF